MGNTKVCIIYGNLKKSIENLIDIDALLGEGKKNIENIIDQIKSVNSSHNDVFKNEVKELEDAMDLLHQQRLNVLELQAGLYNAICEFKTSENENFVIYTSKQEFKAALSSDGIDISKMENDLEKITKADEIVLPDSPDNNVLEAMEEITGADLCAFETPQMVIFAMTELEEKFPNIEEEVDESDNGELSYNSSITNPNDIQSAQSTSTQLRQNSSSSGHSSGGSNSNYGSSSGGYTDKNSGSLESNTDNNTTTEEPTENKNEPETKEPAENKEENNTVKEEQTTTENQTTQNSDTNQSPQQNSSNTQQTAPQNSSTSQSNVNNQVIAGENTSDTLDSNPTEQVETDVEDNTGDVQGEGKDYTIPTAPTFTDVLEEQLIPKNNESVSNSSVVAPAAIGLGMAGLAGVTTKKVIDKKKKPRENRFIIPQNNFFPEETNLTEDNTGNSTETKDSSHELYEFIKDQMK